MTTDGGGLPDIPLGRRVVLRYRLPAGYPQPLTDVIGELVSLDPPTVRGVDGQLVAVTPDRVIALKALGPRPIRTKEIRALEAAAADGWPGIEHAWIDGWLARAGNGFTSRANSAVPLGSSGEPAGLTADTLHRIAAWYAERGLPLLLALPDRLAPIPPGWNSWRETVMMAIDIENFVLPQGPSMVRVAATPDAAWQELNRRDGEAPTPQRLSAPLPDLGVLTAVRDGELGFASLGVPTPIAIGRGALTTAPDGRGWIGLTCVAVAAEHRRKGLGSLVCAELIRWGHSRGATHAYLQVEAGNSAAIALYRELGFLEHHTYRYAAPTALAGSAALR
ncbi:putative acetyltransferase [Nocardia brasiliensis NBRC 14402]|uniref:N-acetylglutamate synthase, CG3035 family n=1 Tax=Nocardia brasiliensis TaxID=37326 RepID=UPI00030E9260|nr:GNAT family N-acetyltransferase [Nocardia brasiliensis]ASF11198.1 N-acetyltransferase [Nocardia brasiliensis]GAJ84290.1 putative acetyltransferase [Nocardia brasiliensis NBRC 14402]SUB10097.1 ribosomal-protein-alanine N-acetyltransferase [Nocardia brasiliensis]